MGVRWLACCMLAACGGDVLIVSQDTDADSDTHVEVDSDADSDSDTGADSEADSDSDTSEPPLGLVVELTWSLDVPGPMQGDDLDLHLIRGDGVVGVAPLDCHWNNARPNWDDPSSTDDDPALVLDDTGGTGPERIEMPVAQDLSYRVAIVDAPGMGPGTEGPNEATVVIWVDGDEAWRGTVDVTGDASTTEVVMFNPRAGLFAVP